MVQKTILYITTQIITYIISLAKLYFFCTAGMQSILGKQIIMPKDSQMSWPKWAVSLFPYSLVPVVVERGGGGKKGLSPWWFGWISGFVVLYHICHKSGTEWDLLYGSLHQGVSSKYKLIVDVVFFFYGCCFFSTLLLMSLFLVS